MRKAVEITRKKLKHKDTPSPSYRANCTKRVTDGHLKISNQYPDTPAESQQVHVRQLICAERRENCK
jgi:hypothetical protein